MNKVKNRIKRGFTVVPNELINDLSISAVARFLFVYMASKPDDWDFYQNELMNATGIKDPRTFRRHMSELIGPGWITRERTRAEGAQFSSYDYTLHEKPERKKCTVEPECKFSTVEEMHGAKNAPLTNKDFKQRNTNNKERDKRARFQPPTLEEVYSYFLEKTGKENFARREAEKFCNYYESNGWKVGRNKMKSWQHAAGGWLSRCDDYKTNNNGSSQNGSNEPKHGIATVESIKRAAAKAAHEIRTAREQADDISDLFAWAEESAA
jgi:hypothetical protein